MMRSDAVTSAIDYTLNPDLRGLTPLQCMDLIVRYCGVVGLRVILVRLSSKADNLGKENFWYIPGDSYYTESRLVINCRYIINSFDKYATSNDIIPGLFKIGSH